MLFQSPQKNQTPRGKFIVLYGINNIGKTTQAKLLTKKLNELNIKAEYIKYPIYNLKPSGVILNNYLRDGNWHKLSPREVQIIYTLNRTQHEELIKNKLNNGVTIVAEDYTGTGIAWGMSAGVDEQFLKYINSHLLSADLSILMDGHRFFESVEKNHKYETNNELINRARSTHLQLAQEYGWPVIDANKEIQVVHSQIWNQVENFLFDSKNKKLPALIEKFYPETNDDKIDIKYINNLHDDANPTLLTKGKKIYDTSKNWPLKINKINSEAKLPTRAYATDAGLDLYANDNHILMANDIILIGTGIRMAIPVGYAGLIWDKSGLASQGLKTAGGVIDASYRGEIKIIIINLNPHAVRIVKGQKIAQIIIQKIATPFIEESNDIGQTPRNENNFGSSGLY